MFSETIASGDKMQVNINDLFRHFSSGPSKSKWNGMVGAIARPNVKPRWAASTGVTNVLLPTSCVHMQNEAHNKKPSFAINIKRKIGH